MNLFILEETPTLAAEAYCNKHLVKLPTEIANVVLWPVLYAAYSLPKTQTGSERKLSHENHPVSKWVRETSANYEWTLRHFAGLLYRYQQVYRRQHDAMRVYSWARTIAPHLNFSKDYPTPFARCFSGFSEQLKNKTNTVEAYREFYWLDKKDFARWPSASDVPKWWPDSPEKYVDKSFLNGKYKNR